MKIGIFGRSAIAAVIALALTLTVCLPTTGCTSADVQKSVSLIEAELPTAVSLAAEVAQIVAVFAGPQSQSPIASTSATIQAALTELQTLCASYTQNPSATTYKSILNVVDTLVTTGDQALLNAAHISNSDSQQKGTAVIGSLDVILHIIDGYLQATQSTAQVKANAARRTVKLSQVVPYWSSPDMLIIGNAFGEPAGQVIAYAEAQGF